MNMEDMDIMDKTINAYYNADSPATAAGEGVTRKILAHSENLMVCELHYEKGAIGALHSHPHEQITYIVSGRFEFTIDGRKFIVGPGDTTYKQPNVVHGSRKASWWTCSHPSARTSWPEGGKSFHKATDLIFSHP